MKILHLIASMNPASGGPTEGINRMSSILIKLGHSRDIACLDAPDDPWILKASSNTFALGESYKGPAWLNRSIPWRRYRYSRKLVPWLKENAARYDVVVINGVWNYCALAARRAFYKKPVRYFVFTHGMLDPWFRRTYPLKTLLKQIFWLFSEGPLIAGAQSILFTTEEERVLARNAFWPYRCRETVVGYGTEDVKGNPQKQIALFRARLPQLGDARFLLFLSRIHKKKGCDLLIEAFAKIAAEHPRLHLVMAGPDQVGWSAKLKKIAQQHNIADRVHWPGMLVGDEKWGAFRACEAFILPSHQENFGIVVAEAMACSKPVLITNKVNIWREVVDGGGGLFVNDDLPGIESLLARFLALSPCEQKQMGENGRATFLARFDMEINVAALVEVFGRGKVA